MARLTQVPIDPDDETVASVFAGFAREGREPIALYRTLAAAPWLLEAYSGLARALRYRAALPRALRELVILRGAQRARSAYEWTHHRPMAAKAGVPDAKVQQLSSWRDSDLFDPPERAALRCVEEVAGAALSDDAYAELERHFGPAEIVELVVLCAFYEAVGRIIQGLGVEVEPEYAPYLDGLADGPSRSQRLPATSSNTATRP